MTTVKRRWPRARSCSNSAQSQTPLNRVKLQKKEKVKIARFCVVRHKFGAVRKVFFSHTALAPAMLKSDKCGVEESITRAGRPAEAQLCLVRVLKLTRLGGRIWTPCEKSGPRSFERGVREEDPAELGRHLWIRH